ncbi:magnesium chelatase subunit H [Prosthecomicrobium sp. N25]|uniref:magnesium chelatase subunit H n=1 Tax=Prosthecomicrobium sp. N25 TaxID=3129254 RepID=UPI003076DAF6
MRKRISAADPTPIRIAIVTLDCHLSSVAERAADRLRAELPGLAFSLHAAAEWDDPAELDAARRAVDRADIVFASMLFMEDHIRAIMPALEARRETCDALVCCMSAPEIARLTRMGRFSMAEPASGPLALLKRLRGAKGSGGAASAGAEQMKMLRRLPKLLKYIPGTAQDVRAYFLALQYWLAGSEDNLVNLVRLLVSRYADGTRKGLRQAITAEAPVEYPEVGVYHPRLPGRFGEDAARLPAPAKPQGTVGVLVMRSYVIAGNAAHYDGVIAAIEARGLRAIPAFASGLDARPAIERFFMAGGRPVVDAVVSLTGFSLVGGPAYNDARAAEETLAALDVPYLAAHPVEFQTIEQWQDSERGLLPIEATIMVAIPELDGATGPMVFGGRAEAEGGRSSRSMSVHAERAAMLAARVDRLVQLRRKARAERKVAVVLFNFPPNAGATGTAAFLSVFESLFNTLKGLASDGYRVELPASVDALRDRIIEGNARIYGATANVLARIPTADHVRRERHLKEIETAWGPAPGRHQTDGQSIFVLGAQFGNVLVGVQPAFGVEGDPMRLLFERSFSPTHAFSAFYRYLREDFGADAVLHFGTHGALEFMPGKQAGMTAKCWPDRLIGDLPNLYLYAANNPTEGAIAKRRAAATLVSYLTPPIAYAGLYRGLLDLKASIDGWRHLDPDAEDRGQVAALVQAQAAVVDLAAAEPAWGPEEAEARIATLAAAVYELEYTMIPHGLHIVGEPAGPAARVDTLLSMAEAVHGVRLDRPAVEAIVDGSAPLDVSADAGTAGILAELQATDRLLARDTELTAILAALDGRYIRPAPSGDLLRTPAILPTGRNLHGFDPFRIPSAFALRDGARQAARLLARHVADGHPFPESVALVLWGTDNMKTEGGPIAQALALMGARPRFDSYGRVCGAALVPLDELDHPRVDVVMTISGIFRDLLPLQTRMLAEASYLAGTAEEPVTRNFVRKHVLGTQAEKGFDLETASLRVFSNADGAYGANVNQLIEHGGWTGEDELAETYTRRKCFAYGRSGAPVKQAALLDSILSRVDLAYQNLESVELGVTTLDQYVDTLGGVTRAAKRARGAALPVYIGDQTRGEGTVRTLSEQVALESRTRILNEKWYEGMLKHGYEGVRQIEAHVTNTLGWSATTGQVAPWVYREITRTFVLDPAMRERLASLNPTAAARVAGRLIEAHERSYWTPDEETLAALREAGDALEDRLEGVSVDVAA